MIIAPLLWVFVPLAEKCSLPENPPAATKRTVILSEEKKLNN